MLVGLLLAVVGLAALAGGIIIGVAIYAHLHQHFLASIESRMVRKAQLERNRAILDRSILEQTKERLVAEYGPDLSAKRQTIVDEELARVLQGRNGGGE